MDKYEFNIKVEQIKKLVNKGDYETAMKIADGIDWRRVRSTSLLTSISQVYERNEEYQEAKDILLLAFERAPIGKGLLFKLTDLALRGGDVSEAEAYYREFCDLSGEDPRQNLLRYLILEAKKAPIEQRLTSLERYCQDELDEKWLYKLAELYQQVGREDDCVRICDKIMLLFGLGKYVDKAMDLKLQYAPLTKYQMDLVENRDKYEEKLRAVEQEYNAGKRQAKREEDLDDAEYDEGTEPDEELIASMHEAEAERSLAEEIAKMPRETYDEEETVPEGGETRVLYDIRSMKDQGKREEQPLSAPQPLNTEEAGIQGLSHSPEFPERTATAGIQAVRSLQARAREEKARAEKLQAEKAAAETAADRERQLMENYEEEEETVIEDWDLEPEDPADSNHLMIEAEEAQSGLALALDSLKKIHRELGTRSSVAKISGQNLNRRGIFSVADRLTGKDFIVEHAADLDSFTIQELVELMESDESGMIVVLIDTPARMEELHHSSPVLAGKFQYIGCRPSEQENRGAHEARAQRQAALETEQARRQAEYEAEIRRKRQAEYEAEQKRQAEARAYEEQEARRQAELDAELERERQAEEAAELERKRQAEAAAELERKRQAEIDAELEKQRLAEYAAETARMESASSRDGEESEEGDAEDYAGVKGRYLSDRDEDEEDSRYSSREDYEDESSDRYEEEEDEPGSGYGRDDYREDRYEEDDYEDDDYEDDDYQDDGYEDDGYQDDGYEEQDGSWKDDGEEGYGRRERSSGSDMDVEEFAQYACKYASEIDCSISGKSMLALYERAEMMEEDGVPLNKKTAEDLIEEAADKAEKPSFGGLFSSKYDKEGLLILKEKHFFD